MSSWTTRHVAVEPAGTAPEQVGAGERRDERVCRSVDELGRGRELAQPAVDDHADLLGERGGVFEVVRDEDRRQRELVQQLLQLRAHRSFRVGVEGGERFVEQDHAGPARERAGERDALALATGERRRPSVREVRDAESFEVLVGALLAGVGDVLADGQVREERVFLEDEPDSPLVGLAEETALAVEPDVVAERDPPARRPDEPRDRAQHRGLAGARRADEGDGADDLER